MHQGMVLTGYASFVSLKHWIFKFHQSGLWEKENRVTVERKLWKKKLARLRK